VQYLDRHALAKLTEYVRLRDAPVEARATRSEEVELWLTVAYDRATDVARQAFVDLVQGVPGGWPWTAVTPVQVDLSDVSVQLVEDLERAPPALILILMRSSLDPDTADPTNYLGDGSEWEPLRHALITWTPDRIEAFMRDGIWSPVTTDADEPDTEPVDTSGPKSDAPETTDSKESPTPRPAPVIPMWKMWQTWALVGGVALAVGATTWHVAGRRG